MLAAALGSAARRGQLPTPKALDDLAMIASRSVQTCRAISRGLSPLAEIPARTRAELIAHLRPGVDGLVLADGLHSAVFIPAMWEQIPDVNEFIDHLLIKGRFARTGWPAGMRAERFTAEHFVEGTP